MNSFLLLYIIVHKYFFFMLVSLTYVIFCSLKRVAC